MVPFGGQVGTIACVGKSMGEGNPKKARIYLKIATILMLIVDFLCAFILVVEKEWFVKLFTSSPVLIDLV